MARYRRRGHWRRGRNGTVHWVSSHEVDRGARAGWDSIGHMSAWSPVSRARTSAPRRRPSVKVTWNPPPEEPNASCPICSKPVWFFRNKNGGCAYFDAIGKP